MEKKWRTQIFPKYQKNQLAKVQRKLSNLKKGTPERNKQKQIVSKVHKNIRNQRSNFCHQISRKIVNEYEYICIEDSARKK